MYKITTELLYNDITPYNGVNCFVLFTDKNEYKVNQASNTILSKLGLKADKF